MSVTTILIGASVRAAAFSAQRAGMSPWCADLFADADLRAVAPSQRCSFSDYPQALAELLCDAPAAPIIYTGGLENYPQFIDRLAADRPLWGNDRDALKKSRDPICLANLYAESGIKHPPVHRHANGETDLRKPLTGAGGANISRVGGVESMHGFYYQQFIAGPSYSAVYCACADRIELLGITEQLVGERWLHAKPFQYCGSIGPANVPSKCSDALMRIGDVLHRGCGLRGLFGVDFILHENEPWPIEVNPRYTASIEVLEHATGLRTLERHRMAFDPDNRSGLAKRAARTGNHEYVGKAILFAPRQLVFPHSIPWASAIDPFVLPEIADVPHGGDTIAEGWPILTIFAHGATRDDCLFNLRRRAGEIQSSLLPQ